MAKKQKPKPKPGGTPSPDSPRRERGNGSPGKWFAAAQAFNGLVATFGWPGLLVILGYLFIIQYGSLEQKREIIDTFVLGKGPESWRMVVMTVVFVLVLLAQRTIYTRALATKQGEVDRLALWKTNHQDQSIQAPLHTSIPPGSSGT
jgi:hypothetical protein